jgi:hypothetical protein
MLNFVDASGEYDRQVLINRPRLHCADLLSRRVGFWRVANANETTGRRDDETTRRTSGHGDSMRAFQVSGSLRPGPTTASCRRRDPNEATRGVKSLISGMNELNSTDGSPAPATGCGLQRSPSGTTQDPQDPSSERPTPSYTSESHVKPKRLSNPIGHV